MRQYEVMTIHRPDLAEDEVVARIAEVEAQLTGNGASIEGRDLWGKRRFVYEIDHLSDGYYSVLTFRAEPPAVQALDRSLSLADEVVRHKIVRRGE